MSGPWEDFQPQPQEAGPWTDFPAQAQEAGPWADFIPRISMSERGPSQAPAWAKTVGPDVFGAATQARGHGFPDTTNESIRPYAAARFARDAEFGQKSGEVPRPDIQRARDIVAREGLRGLRPALNRGELLPSVLGPLGLAPFLLPDVDDNASDAPGALYASPAAPRS